MLRPYPLPNLKIECAYGLIENLQRYFRLTFLAVGRQKRTVGQIFIGIYAAQRKPAVYFRRL